MRKRAGSQVLESTKPEGLPPPPVWVHGTRGVTAPKAQGGKAAQGSAPDDSERASRVGRDQQPPPSGEVADTWAGWGQLWEVLPPPR